MLRDYLDDGASPRTASGRKPPPIENIPRRPSISSTTPAAVLQTDDDRLGKSAPSSATSTTTAIPGVGRGDRARGSVAAMRNGRFSTQTFDPVGLRRATCSGVAAEPPLGLEARRPRSSPSTAFPQNHQVPEIACWGSASGPEGTRRDIRNRDPCPGAAKFVPVAIRDSGRTCEGRISMWPRSTRASRSCASAHCRLLTRLAPAVVNRTTRRGRT